MPHQNLAPSSILVFVVACALLLAACPDERVRPNRDGGVSIHDADMLGPFDGRGGCDPAVDSDGDGIADSVEGDGDPDGDGISSDLDDDSDGDGIPDREEHRGADPCTRPDADSDGIPNWLDLDSDNDGLPDAEERAFGTDPYSTDTDGDGVTDLGEVRGTMTDPTDRTSTIPEGDFFIVLPYMDARVQRTLRFNTHIQRADVYFLIDTTASMSLPIRNVQESLTRISGELRARIRDVQMGVGRFEDFPFDEYGGPADVAYHHEQDITDDLNRVQGTLNGLVLGDGFDLPEAQVEALYQMATGEGGSWSLGGRTHSIAPRSCPTLPDERTPRRGYPCFRGGSLPIVLLVSDNYFHNGLGGTESYRWITPEPHTFEQTTDALNHIGARVIGVAINGGGNADQIAITRATGTVRTDGSPLVYHAAGGAVSDAIIEGVDALVGGTPQDVSTTTENVPDNPHDVDARGFIKSIIPLEGYSSTGVPGSQPGESYTSKDDTTFYAVVPGTMVDFRVDFQNDFVEPPATAQIYRAIIVVIGNGVARLDERRVYIVVPPENVVILI